MGLTTWMLLVQNLTFAGIAIRIKGAPEKERRRETAGRTYSFTSTSTPMLRAVPLTWAMTPSRSKLFRSGILILAISFTCFSVILPTRFLFGSAANGALDQHKDRGGLGDERKAAVRENGDDDRNDEAFLVFRGSLRVVSSDHGYFTSIQCGMGLCIP